MRKKNTIQRNRNLARNVVEFKKTLVEFSGWQRNHNEIQNRRPLMNFTYGTSDCSFQWCYSLRFSRLTNRLGRNSFTAKWSFSPWRLTVRNIEIWTFCRRAFSRTTHRKEYPFLTLTHTHLYGDHIARNQDQCKISLGLTAPRILIIVRNGEATRDGEGAYAPFLGED